MVWYIKLPIITPTEYGNINSSIVNNLLYAIWYDMLNIANNGATYDILKIANNGATEYGNIQVNNILYTILLV